MPLSILVGTVGVAIILVAFILNLARRLHESSPVYLWLNIVGSAMAGWHAWDLRSWPLLTLEIVWGIAAVVKLIAGRKG